MKSTQPSQTSLPFLNRNKNPAAVNVYSKDRFSFYNNTNLLNPRPGLNSENQNPKKIQTSAIWAHLNLNTKAREELEKKKKEKALEEKAKAEEKKVEEVAKLSQEPITNDVVLDNTPAIPITSYSSYQDDEDEEEEEDDDDEKKKEDQETKKVVSIGFIKRKNEVLLKTESDKAKKNKVEETADDEDEDEGASYFNVFKANEAIKTSKPKTTNTAKPTVPPLKMAVKKQPIIKAGQTQKDREEITYFIGKQKFKSFTNQFSLKIFKRESIQDYITVNISV